MNLVTPKAAAKQKLLFNKPTSEAGSLSKSSCLAAARGVSKFIATVTMNLVTLLGLLKSDLDVQQTHLGYYCQLTISALY
jgi:hypothetical protein